MSSEKIDTLFPEESSETVACSWVVRVAFDNGVDSEFDYLLPDKFLPVYPGQRLLAPFGTGNKPQIAFCTKAGIPPDKSFAAGRKKTKLKKIISVVDTAPLLNEQLLSLADWISTYYICPLGLVLAAMVPAAVKKEIGVKSQRLVYLAKGQPDDSDKIKSKKQRQILKILELHSAFSQAAAVNLQGLLLEADCTIAPVKKLLQTGLVKICQRKILPSLPVIPDSMLLKTREVIPNDDQDNALEHIKAQLDSNQFNVIVLFGVTDSGKTEVYIRAVDLAIKSGKTAIVLLPEIALTAQTVQRFSSRFEKVAVMHSGLNPAQRNAQWQKIKDGQADVVIGARSAVFAPLNNLGLIVVDEEHEPGYKQDSAPRYHARDVAVKRAQLANALCILGSATPSLETLFNCTSKKHFSLLRLPKRVTGAGFPEMKLVDMRYELPQKTYFNLISRPLQENLEKTLSEGRQAILLLNRRGYSNFIFCSSCKHTLHCRNCDVTLTFHKTSAKSENLMQAVAAKFLESGAAVCHHCGAKTLVPKKCPFCNGPFIMIGLGSQKLEEELKMKFPAARIARVDSDSMAGADYYRLIRDFAERRIDILAGTQILAKGLHFPLVTLVGIINADTCLYLPDFRTNERTFQLITQVAGRAGRAEKKGIVFVQTFLPDQPAIKYALNADFDGFLKEELKHRKACNLPPYWRLTSILLRDRDFDRLTIASEKLKNQIDRIIQSQNLKIIVRGPMPAVINRIQRFHRIQIILQSPDALIMQQLLTALRNAEPIRPAVAVAIDVDPVNLL